MPNTRLATVERAYFVRKLGGATPTTPLNQLKRRYWMTQVPGSNALTPFNQLEKRWLMGIITGAGATPSDSDSVETLWKQAVSAIGQTPVQYPNQNKITFYIHAP